MPKKWIYSDKNGCHFRQGNGNHDLQVRLDVNVARFAGYKCLRSFLSANGGSERKKLIAMFGRTPKWVPLMVNGEDTKLIRNDQEDENRD